MYGNDSILYFMSGLYKQDRMDGTRPGYVRKEDRKEKERGQKGERKGTERSKKEGRKKKERGHKEDRKKRGNLRNEVKDSASKYKNW